MPPETPLEKAKKEAEIKRQGALTGAEVLTPMEQEFFKKFPALMSAIQAKQKNDKVLFDSLSTQLKFFSDQRKEELAALRAAQQFNDNVSAGDRIDLAPYAPNPELQDTINKLKKQVSDILNPPIPEEIQRLEDHEEIDLGQDVALTQEQFTEFINDPTKAQQVLNSLTEDGKDAAARNFANMVSEELISRGTQEDPAFQPLLEQQQELQQVSEVAQPEEVGPTEDRFANIRKNIGTFFQEGAEDIANRFRSLTQREKRNAI